MSGATAPLFQPYALALLSSCVACAGLALFAFLRREVPAAAWLARLMGTGALWTLFDLLQVLTADPSAKLFWARMSYLGIVTVPVLWLIFAAEYGAEGPRPTPRILALLAVVPTVSLLLSWTGDWHRLMWYPTGLGGHAEGTVLAVARGPWFWVHVGYSYLMLSWGGLLLLRIFLRPFIQHRLQTAALVGGLLAPWGLNMLRLANWPGLEAVDLTPFALSLSGSVAALSLFHFRTQDLLPVARARIVESIGDGVLVLDRLHRVLRVNPAAAELIGAPALSLQLRPLADVLPDLEAGLATAGSPGAASFELVLDRGGQCRDLELLSSPLEAPGGRTAGYVVVMRDVSERKALERRLQHLAYHDALTGLPNREGFERRLDAAVLRARASGEALAVAFVGLDNFKVINESLGHGTGDQLLKSAADQLAAALGDGATVGRWGGDEFTVLVEGIGDADEAMALAERIRSAFARPIQLGHRRFFVSVSCGVTLDRAGQRDARDLTRDADLALFEAKSSGKARCVLFHAEMGRRALDRLNLENALRVALERDGLHLAYQPIVDVETGAVRAVEALARWELPGRGAVPPAVFVRIAEETGLIADLGSWVLRSTCAQLRDWRREAGAGARDVALSVNVSTRQLTSGILAEEVAGALAANHLDPALLWLEITETALMEDTEATAAQLHSLRELGVKIVIDDFGTGHSALAYLKDLPVDALKIDRSFVSGLGAGRSDEVIMGGIVKLGHALGLQVTGEGVEQPQQLAALRRHGCDLAQGYWFSRPVKPGVVRAWLSGPPGLPPQAAAAP